MAEKQSVYYIWQDHTELKLVDADMFSWIDLVHTAYCTVLSEIPEGRSVTFSVKAELPDGGYYGVSNDKEVVEVLEMFKSLGRAIPMHICDVKVGEAIEGNYKINGYDSKMIGRPRPRRRTVGTVDLQEIPSTSIIHSTEVSRPVLEVPSSAISTPTVVNEAAQSGNQRQQKNTTSQTDHLKEHASTDLRKKKGKEPAISIEEFEDDEDDPLDSNWDIDVEDTRESSVDSQGGEESEYDEEDDLSFSDIEEEVEDESTTRDTEADIDHLEKVNIHVGSVFEDVYTYRRTLTDLIVQEGCKVIRLKNEIKRVTTICASEGCQWSIHAARDRDGRSFKVKRYEPTHTCKREASNSKNANAVWIARKLANRLRVDPDMKIKSMEAAINARYAINSKPQQLYRARLVAKQENLASHKKSYALLQPYGEMLLQRNPGNSFKMQFEDMSLADSVPVFKRLFVCFSACKEGFIQGCRPFIGIDGCHLKGAYQGILLAATSMDANNGLFPIAFSIVESENKGSWLWFLTTLHDALSYDGVPLTFMSDNQKVC